MNSFFKRILDILLSSVGIILFMPMGIIIIFCIMLDSSGMPIFTQKRVGKGCNQFVLYKFRSMSVQPNENSSYQTQKGDVRITKIGKFLRKTSLDELPQLFNILNGNMSLIGPRPYVPIQKKDYNDDEWEIRHSIRPGLTGLAQVAARTKKQFTKEESLKLDLEYIKSYNLFLDIKIIFSTIKIVLKMKNF